MKKNKEVMTRKSYRRKKEINKVWVSGVTRYYKELGGK